MGIFGPPLENPEELRKAYELQARGGFGAKPPLRTRLLLTLPWLARLQWWHLGLAIVLAFGALLAIPMLIPRASPGGAILATVDGEPITRIDISAEATAQGLPESDIDDKTRDRLLKQVINRKLLALAARKAGIEDNAGFKASLARMKEVMAAGILAQRFAGSGDQVSEVDVRSYIAAHPLQFAGRQTIIVDAILTDPAAAAPADLQSAETVDDMAAKLRLHAVGFQRGVKRLDTASLPPQVAADLAKSAPGQMFIVSTGTKLMAGAMLARTPNLLSEMEQQAAARDALTGREVKARVEAALTHLRKKADIRQIGDGH